MRYVKLRRWTAGYADEEMTLVETEGTSDLVRFEDLPPLYIAERKRPENKQPVFLYWADSGQDLGKPVIGFVDGVRAPDRPIWFELALPPDNLNRPAKECATPPTHWRELLY